MPVFNVFFRRCWNGPVFNPSAPCVLFAVNGAPLFLFDRFLNVWLQPFPGDAGNISAALRCLAEFCPYACACFCRPPGNRHTSKGRVVPPWRTRTLFAAPGPYELVTDRTEGLSLHHFQICGPGALPLAKFIFQPDCQLPEFIQREFSSVCDYLIQQMVLGFLLKTRHRLFEIP